MDAKKPPPHRSEHSRKEANRCETGSESPLKSSVEVQTESRRRRVHRGTKHPFLREERQRRTLRKGRPNLEHAREEDCEEAQAAKEPIPKNDRIYEETRAPKPNLQNKKEKEENKQKLVNKGITSAEWLRPRSSGKTSSNAEEDEKKGKRNKERRRGGKEDRELT